MSRVTDLLATYLSSDDHDAARGVPVLPLSFIGVGFLIAWLCCTHLPHCFVFADLSAAGDELVDYGMRVGDVGTFLVVIAFSRRLGPLSRHRSFCTGAIVAGALCTLVAPGLVITEAPDPLVAVVSVVAGCSGAILFLLWAEVFGQLGSARCVLYGGTGCVVAGVASLVISNLTYGASTVAIALLPLISGVMVGISLTRLPGERHRGEPVRGVRYPVPWKLVGLMALAGFASGFAGSLLVTQDGVGAVHRIVATVLFGLLLLALFVVRRGVIDIRVLARITLPLAIASLILIPLAGQTAGTAVSFLVKLSYVSFALFVLLMLAHVVYRHDIPSARVFASARAASELAMLVGIVLRRAMRSAGILDSDTILWLITLVGLVVVTGCVLLWHSERSVSSDWGSAGVDPSSGARIVSDRERLLARCATVAATYHLTVREEEVLSLLASGATPNAIEQELFLSHNTFKTHTRHIYAKLGVHTRSEAVALVQEAVATR